VKFLADIEQFEMQNLKSC